MPKGITVCSDSEHMDAVNSRQQHQGEEKKKGTSLNLSRHRIISKLKKENDIYTLMLILSILFHEEW